MPANRKAQIERINQVSAMARTSWIALLGYLAFIGVTLLGVEDADFFVPSRQTQLPLVNVSIPTASFFIFAPILAAALYIYLHIILLKLWDAIADANTPRIDGHPLADHLNPWLVNDWALTRKGPPYTPARPLLALGNAASFLLVWAAGPLVLFGFWWRSMPAHNEWLTLLLAACLLLSLYAALTSWRTARAWLSRPRREPPSRPWWRAVAVVAGTIAFSWIRTEGGTDHLASRLVDFGERVSGRQVFASDHEQEAWISQARWLPKLHWFDVKHDTPFFGRWVASDSIWNPLARTDLAGVDMVNLPEGWRNLEADGQAYREIWCRREGVDLAACGPPPDGDRPPSSQVMIARNKWCESYIARRDLPCTGAFASLDDRFLSDWNTERKGNIADLPPLDLSGRDLRRVDGRNATLIGANLTGARLESADLAGVSLEGANLGRARLEGANLRAARLEGADLREAHMQGVYLVLSRLLQADLRHAQLDGAYLVFARLDHADLRESRLGGAYLVLARLEGADLRKARLDGAYVRSADFRRSKWDGVSSQSVTAHFADLRGVQGLTQAQLDGLIGHAGTLLPHSLEGASPLFVSSCWENPPDGFDALTTGIAALEFSDPKTIRSIFLCSPGSARRKTGTPLPLDAPYPEGHPLAAR